jgi:hypothetical protein
MENMVREQKCHKKNGMNVEAEKIQYEIKLPLKILAIFSGLLNIYLAYRGKQVKRKEEKGHQFVFLI